MGSGLSWIQSAGSLVRTAIAVLSSLNAKYNALLERIASNPGLPNPKPTSSYWLDDPPFPHLVDMENDVPEVADLVIIGSGIASAASARTVLELTSHLSPPPRVVVLEARQLCSGATGRNGGHIKATPHEVYSTFKRTIGRERAIEIVRFQMRHLGLLLELGRKHPLGEVRRVETVDLFLTKEDWRDAVGEVAELRGLMDGLDVDTWDGEEARRKFDVNEQVKGAISYPAGALWPYRLVTSIWNDLLQTYSNLTISTNTPVTAVSLSSSSYPSHPYRVTFAKGSVQARHVLHATNGFAPQLLPGLKSGLTGALAHMSAQRPGQDFPRYNGSRSWSIIYSPGFDYITQRPSQDGGGDLMIGGGFFRSTDEGLDQVGIWDDGKTDAFPMMHLRGSMQTVFEPNWGKGGDVVKAWTGILGFTGDLMPFVGRVPEKNGKNDEIRAGNVQLASPGQWIAAGFCGEGMVWAWLCGTAVGIMISGREDEVLEEALGRPAGKLRDWFPQELVYSNGRLKRADLNNLADLFA